MSPNLPELIAAVDSSTFSLVTAPLSSWAVLTAPAWIAAVWILPTATDDAITSKPSVPLATLTAGTITFATSVPGRILPASICDALTNVSLEPSIAGSLLSEPICTS